MPEALVLLSCWRAVVSTRGQCPRHMTHAPLCGDRIELGARIEGGRGEASRRRKWLPPFGGVVCWEAEMGETKKGGRYVEPLVPVQEGRETACLARARKLRRPEITGLGVSILEIC
jgi:hypothetical protein